MSIRHSARSPFFYCNRHRSLRRDSRKSSLASSRSRPRSRLPRQNLTDLRQPFAQLAIDALDQVAERLQRTEKALAPQLTAANNQALQQAMPAAVTALTQYRAWLTAKLPTARKDTAIGRDNYIFFLRKVALLPYTPEQLLAMSQQEWSRAVAFEAYQQTRLAGAPPAPFFPTAAAQIQAEKADEEKVRAFLVEQKILSVPAWMKHYRNLLLPAYLEPFQDLGENDDLTGPSRLDQDGTSYIHVPGPDLGFFNLSQAHDPRPILVHEGVPGHYFQLCLGWHNPDPIRRHYYDSGANEGLGFYAEEMMLQAGFFDDNPHTRETIYSFMRLRALRVEVDVKLALGEFTLQQGADYLARTVPMDRAHRARRGVLLRQHARARHLLPDRQAADHAASRRCPAQARQRFFHAAVQQLRLEQRQCAHRAAALGAASGRKRSPLP